MTGAEIAQLLEMPLPTVGAILNRIGDVRTRDLRVERLEQSYARLPNAGIRSRYDYVSPSFDFRAVLVYDQFGLVLDYPHIAIRTA
jgi:hypothetical protein